MPVPGFIKWALKRRFAFIRQLDGMEPVDLEPAAVYGRKLLCPIFTFVDQITGYFQQFGFGNPRQVIEKALKDVGPIGGCNILIGPDIQVQGLHEGLDGIGCP